MIVEVEAMIRPSKSIVSHIATESIPLPKLKQKGGPEIKCILVIPSIPLADGQKLMQRQPITPLQKIMVEGNSRDTLFLLTIDDAWQ